MLAYWLLFLFFAVGATLSVRSQSAQTAAPVGAATLKRIPPGPMFAIGMVTVALMIGLRWEVGGDWANYLRIFNRTALLGFWQQFISGDPAYQLVNWASARAGAGIWLVNLVCAVIFCWGLGRLLRSQPEPWLAMVVAVPYLVIVVGMGLTRQATALGLIMAGLAAVFRGGSLGRYLLYVAAASLFHKTALVALPLLAFVFPRSRGTDLVMIVGAVAALYVLLLQGSVDFLQRNYIGERLASQGAAIRVSQLAVAATLFFVIRRALQFTEREDRVWRNFAIISLLMLPVLFFSPSSTVVDRISLNLLPLQLAVLSRFPQWLTTPVLGRMLVVGYSALVLFVWLNFAIHAGDWIPYRNLLFDTDAQSL